MSKRFRNGEEGLFQKLKWAIYSFRSKIHHKIFSKFKRKKSNMSTKRRNETAFICVVLALPMFIFAVFYVGVNIQCIAMAFQKYDGLTGKYTWATNPWENFSDFFTMLKEEEFMRYAAINSFALFFLAMFVNLPLHLINAYYVYKRYLFHKLFRLLLFFPSILSNVITVTLFKYFLLYGLNTIYSAFGWGEAPNLLYSAGTGFQTTMAYSVWVGFGGGIIMFLGLMNRISPSILEAAALDGVKPMQEFRYIIFPLIFPTISVYIVENIATLFSAQGSLFTFYGRNARKEFYTFGYYYYVSVLGESGVAKYPMAAASGLIFTAVVAPVTLIARKIFDKLNPTTDM